MTWSIYEEAATDGGAGNKSRSLIDEASVANQDPTGDVSDVPTTIIYGNVSDITTPEATLTTAGILSFLENSLYGVGFDLEFGRESSAGQSIIYFSSKLSFGGSPFAFVPWTIGATINASTDTQAINRIVNFEVDSDIAPLPWAVDIVFWRDSSGSNSGGLRTRTPTLQGTDPTVPAVPSARILVNIYE